MIKTREKCKVTYIANEGFLIESANKKILIDALFNYKEEDSDETQNESSSSETSDNNPSDDTEKSTSCDSPDENILYSMSNSLPPFDNIDIIAITHFHIDHFNEEIVINHMLNNPDVIILCPKQVDKELSLNPYYNDCKNRIIAITPGLYTKKSITVKEIPIKMIRIEHSRYSEKDEETGKFINMNEKTENIGYIFTLNNTTFFHCGDSNPWNENEYWSLINENIDVVFNNGHIIDDKKNIEIIKKSISNTKMILMHIDPNDKNYFIDYFKNDNSTLIFENKMDCIAI